MEAQLLGMMGWGKPGVHQVNGSGLTFPAAAKPPSASGADPKKPVMDALEKATGRKMQVGDMDRQIINKNLLSQMFTRPLPITWYGGNETVATIKDMFIKR
jgi:hypothetical protein